MEDFLHKQKNNINSFIGFLSGFDEGNLPGKVDDKWTVKEVLGHLIDSAANNHQRFVRATLTDNLVFQGYNQDYWVKLHNYQTQNYKTLIELFSNYNYHIIRLIENLPEEILEQIRIEHNLNEIAFHTVPKNEPTTLKYLIEDYYLHMEHHFKQINNLLNLQ